MGRSGEGGGREGGSWLQMIARVMPHILSQIFTNGRYYIGPEGNDTVMGSVYKISVFSTVSRPQAWNCITRF